MSPNTVAGTVADGPWVDVAGRPAFVGRLQTWYVASGGYTTAEQYAISAITALGFALLVVGLYAVGRLLERRFSSDAIRAVQGTTITAVSVLCSWFLVVVWGQEAAVRRALGFMQIGPEHGVKALVTFIVLAGGYTVTRLTKRSIKYGAGRSAITPHQREVAHHVVQLLVFVPVVMFTIALWDVPFRNLFLGAGVLGIVLGFAARKTLSGVLAGFVILFARPFEIGDWVRIGDREGIVTDITIYNTTVRTFNEEHVLVPNDTVTQNEVVNYSRTERLRLHTDVGVDYDADVGRAAEVAAGAMADLEDVADQPSPDVIRLEFADSAVVLRLRYWIETPTIQEKWRAQNAVVEAVKSAFEREGIKIPFPQRELMGRAGTKGLQVDAGTAGSEAVGAGAELAEQRPDEDGRELDGREIDGRADAEPDGTTRGGSDPGESSVEEPVQDDYAGDPHGERGESPEPDGDTHTDAAAKADADDETTEPDRTSKQEGPTPLEDIDETVTEPPADEDAYR